MVGVQQGACRKRKQPRNARAPGAQTAAVPPPRWPSRPIWPQSLHALHRHRTVLLLQGPMGPFFDRLARHLQQQGTQVLKLNFNGGDDHFFRACDADRFTGHPDEWPAWLADYMSRRGVDAIVMFGQMKPIHLAAQGVARQLATDVFVFEEGYFRPFYVTLERGGVNARSGLPRDVQSVRATRPPRPPRPRETRARFARRAWQAVQYAVTTSLARRRYPHYEHHRPLTAMEGLRWIRGGFRKLVCRATEHRLRRSLAGTAMHKRYFLVPVQVHSDSQVTHSSFDSIECFMGIVLESFADHAPPESHLVFKHHPMDLSHRDHGDLLRRLALEFGVVDRVHYLHDGNLPALLQGARGMVTLNSTTALQALHHQCPVLALGESFYTIDGLVRRGEMAAFWRAPGDVDAMLFARYRNLVIHETQLNASFHGDAPALAPWPLAANSDRWPLAHRLRPAIGSLAALAALLTCGALTLSWLM
jgi:capsule polysaccharide modification protein KpsS